MFKFFDIEEFDIVRKYNAYLKINRIKYIFIVPLFDSQNSVGKHLYFNVD
jgi:hypothetical protein